MAEGDIRRGKAAGVRELAVQGVLADHVRAVGDDERRRLRAEAYEIIHPIVFCQFTRKRELKRGHTWCATSLRRLEPRCLDRFHDDMDAVLDDIFRNAKVPIHNLEGWVSRRVPVATIEGYRRRRGQRGALQRPRVPGWLAAALGRDAWLLTLAVAVLDFVGNDIPAVPGTWPVDAWAQRRTAMLGADHHGDISHDIETVLAAMRTRPRWHESYVERPLAGKQPPVVALTSESTEDDPASPTSADDDLWWSWPPWQWTPSSGGWPPERTRGRSSSTSFGRSSTGRSPPRPASTTGSPPVSPTARRSTA
ncbi:hypothetical protein [Kutzneria sp. 744]|uniref:hypothetical protein n=1 Tax=Kutzneria sp. (strain 744) TaxID=345341 RepID=UPI0003EEB78B|nr:hypothetical protein [Kutzneria sp. 744]EWM12173.1 hypothetical protein KUTG_02477 [Kutzneria sp. 744]